MSARKCYIEIKTGKFLRTKKVIEEVELIAQNEDYGDEEMKEYIVRRKNGLVKRVGHYELFNKIGSK